MSRLHKTREKQNIFTRFFHWIGSWKLWVKILVLVLIALIATGVVVAVSAVGYVEEKVQVMNEGAEIAEDYDLGLQPVEGFTNILLLGVDTRDMSTIKGSRSDMIMIASINNETFEVTLTSVYRDTYLKLGSTSTYDKITHACVYGGPEMTIKSLNQALDLDIELYGIVNFKAVADLVNAVGGIEVDVQESEIYQLNKYTAATAKNIGQKKYNTVTKAGVQTLEGVQAVSYGRIRKGVGDDYKRTERMRIVVTKVFEKMKQMSFSEVKEIIDMMATQVKTNMKMDDIITLGKNIGYYSINSGSGFPYTKAGGYYNNISYVFPTGLAQDVVTLHRDVFGEENYTISSTASAIASEVASRYANRGATNKSDKNDEDDEDEDEIIVTSETDVTGDASGTDAEISSDTEINPDDIGETGETTGGETAGEDTTGGETSVDDTSQGDSQETSQGEAQATVNPTPDPGTGDTSSSEVTEQVTDSALNPAG